MGSPFLSSEEYDERAHQLYNEGRFDEALEVLREGLALYPTSVELHIGVGYARLAREEYAWARRAFEQALSLEPEHEDALAGLGETLLKFGQLPAAEKAFRRTLELGYQDDIDLMLQIGRALFREASLRDTRPLFEEAKTFFEVAVREAPEMAEAVACVGYVQHRLGEDDGAVVSLTRALALDEDHVEARIYLANIHYDRTEYETALEHLEKTSPDDHWDELGIWRHIELQRSLYGLSEDAEELKPWSSRIEQLGGELDAVDELLAEVEGGSEGSEIAHQVEIARGQLELFGTLLSELADHKREPAPGAIADVDGIDAHAVQLADGRRYVGTWDEIVIGMRDADRHGGSVQEFMTRVAQRSLSERGIRLPSHDAESFLRAGAAAGLLRIVE